MRLMDCDQYRDKPVDIKHISKELGVRYLLDGSIKRAKNRLRVDAQLIDAQTGFQLWSEQYDREVNDIFEVQDDITFKIVTSLSIKLTEEEKRRIANQYTNSIEAYDKFLQGQFLYLHHTIEDNSQSRELFQDAIELDPNFARAFGAKALTYYR